MNQQQKDQCNSDSPPILDGRALLSRIGGRRDFCLELLDLYLQQTLPKMAALEVAVKAENSEEVRRIAHSLKGVSLNLSAMKIAHVADSLERLAAAGELPGIKLMADELILEFGHLQEAIGEFKRRLENGEA
jgi:HPt (histidine-containing phosphotransfer) domain-containing protein